ncbi:MAG: transposase [Cycloclasticus sp. symbiont of Bathymodiolus heckerae]|nr:MAG: transposase [Cycloclasticus sp. symbiont of Bathymodiolus heckerae]
MNKLTDIFCDVDDFCKVFMPEWEAQLIEDGTRKRNRQGRMTMSEIMTIIIAFHSSNHRDFKNYYTGFVARFYKDYFPELLSYTRFLAVMPKALTPLCAYFTHIKGKPTGISFVDATSIKVCHNLRIERHKTFAGIAKRGKGTMGWFYGFKLHIIVNHVGDILAAKITPANVDDRKPVPELAKEMSGKLYADKGYISKALSANLFDKGVELVTNVKKNMKKKLLSAWDKAMLSRRFIIETINDQLKNITQIEHSRHRSMHGFMLNIIAGLIAYSLKENKPSLKITSEEFSMRTTS